MPDIITSHNDETTAAHRQSVRRAIAHMKDNLDESLQLDRLSTVAAVSKFHLIRVFKEITGVSPHLFLAALRMQKAKDLLLTSTLSVTQICLEVGYSSLGTFSRIFHTLVGLAPNSLRAAAKQYRSEDMYRTALTFSRVQRASPCEFLNGYVYKCPSLSGMIFIGAFPKGLPQGTPLSGTILLGAGEFRIPWPKRDRFFLLSLLLPLDFPPFGPVLGDTDRIRVARVLCSQVSSNSHRLPSLSLRPVELTDPPLLVALPTLLT